MMHASQLSVPLDSGYDCKPLPEWNPLSCQDKLALFATIRDDLIERSSVAAPPVEMPMPWGLMASKGVDRKKGAASRSKKGADKKKDGDISDGCCSTLFSSGGIDSNNSDFQIGNHRLMDHRPSLLSTATATTSADSDGIESPGKNGDLDSPKNGARRPSLFSSASADSANGGEVDFGDDIELGTREMTTLMLKNIPCRCSQQEILDAIEEVGFGQLYNFFYLPMTQGQTHNIGYVFIGFYDEDLAEKFTCVMTGYRFKSRKSSKSCEVVPARIQGFQSNLEHFQKRHSVRKRNHPIWRTKL